MKQTIQSGITVFITPLTDTFHPGIPIRNQDHIPAVGTLVTFFMGESMNENLVNGEVVQQRTAYNEKGELESVTLYVKVIEEAASGKV